MFSCSFLLNLASYLRLMRVWSFQSRLGIVLNTVLQSAPAIAHLMVIFITCLVLLAAYGCAVFGYRDSELQDIGTAIYNYIFLLFGGDVVDSSNMRPNGVGMTKPEAIASVVLTLVSHFLMVFVLMNFFMAIIGVTFTKIKRRTWATSTTICQDLARVVAPDASAGMKSLLRQPRADKGARAPALPAQPTSEQLLRVVAGKPHPGSDTAASLPKEDLIRAVRIGNKDDGCYLKLNLLQCVLVQLASSQPEAAEQLRAIAAKQVSRSGPVAEGAAVTAEPGAPPTAAAVAADADGTLAASAAAVAQVLLKLLGERVAASDAIELSMDADLSSLSSTLDAAVATFGAASAPNMTFEHALHKQIYAALWNAISAMERWSTAVARWQGKSTREMNAWLAANHAHIVVRSGKSAAFVPDLKPIPQPPSMDLTEAADMADVRAQRNRQEADKARSAAELAQHSPPAPQVHKSGLHLDSRMHADETAAPPEQPPTPQSKSYASNKVTPLDMAPNNVDAPASPLPVPVRLMSKSGGGAAVGRPTPLLAPRDNSYDGAFSPGAISVHTRALNHHTSSSGIAVDISRSEGGALMRDSNNVRSSFGAGNSFAGQAGASDFNLNSPAHSSSSNVISSSNNITPSSNGTKQHVRRNITSEQLAAEAIRPISPMSRLLQHTAG